MFLTLGEESNTKRGKDWMNPETLNRGIGVNSWVLIYLGRSIKEMDMWQ